MTITTVTYLGYLAAAAILCYALPRVARPYFLLVASYVFYGWTAENRMMLPVLISVTLLTWACGLLAGSTRKRAVRALAVAVPILTGIGLLVWFKYWNMLTGLFGQSPVLLITPLGLSYFLFAALSYPIDVCRGKCEVAKNPLHYAMFVSFFPTMVTGPIERWGHLGPQIARSRRFDYDRLAGGAFRMAWGYFKKMVLADNLNLYVSFVYASPESMSGPQLLAATLLFSVRLYMDFSGCCDIAMGAARILGYDLIDNFDRPFEAVSFADFWRRWHISMTGWFREYVYFPLGGSRCAQWRVLLNTVIVFLVSGLWHGADWRYLAWGLSCGLIMVIARLTARPRAVLAQHNPLYKLCWLRVSIQQCIVFLLFSLTLVFFAAGTYNSDPWAVFGGLAAGWQGPGDWWRVGELLLSSGLDNGLEWMIPAGCMTVFLLEHYDQNIADWIRRRNFVVRWVLYYAVGASILFFAAFGQSMFIYQTY